MAVGRALLNNVTSESHGKTAVVCVAMIDIELTYQNEKLWSINYHCCSSNVGSKWLQAIKTLLYCLSIVVGLYCPALPLLLSDCIFNLPNECDKEDITENQIPNGAQAGSNGFGLRNGYERIRNDEDSRMSWEEIPVDDASPVTCLTLLLGCVQLLPDLKMSFNVKLAVLMFFIYPFSFYFQLALFYVLKPKYQIYERLIKHPIYTKIPEFASSEVDMMSPITILGLTILVLPCWTAILFLKPKDLFLNNCLVCRLFDRVNSHSVSIGDETLQHLKLFPEKTKSLMLALLYLHNRSLRKVVGLLTCYLMMNYRGSRVRRALFSLWLSFSCLFTLFLGLVLAAICLFLLLVSGVFLFIWFSPVTILMVSMGQKIYNTILRASDSICCKFVYSFMVFSICLHYICLLYCVFCLLEYIYYVPFLSEY